MLGVGAVEDFTWKGMLDFTTCTECGRCQCQCPAWNTDKPLSPKLLITGAARPRVRQGALPAGRLRATARRCSPPAATRSEQRRSSARWSATPATAGSTTPRTARRSSTPTCSGPAPPAAPACSSARSTSSTSTTSSTCAATRCWSSPTSPPSSTSCSRAWRTRATPGTCRPPPGWTGPRTCRFEVNGRRRGRRVPRRGRVAVLGRLRRRATRTAPRRPPARSPSCSTSRASTSRVLGNGETCTGDPARRAGNEFVFQVLAAAERRDAQRGQGQEGRHHLRALLQHAEERVPAVRRRARGRAPHPAAQPAGARRQADPGRRRRRRGEALDHLPRPLLPRPPQPGLRAAARAARRCSPAPSSPRCRATPSGPSAAAPAARGCGWRRTIGERININRTTEAVATGADQIAVGCPFCRVMLSDGLTAQQAAGEAREEVEVLDVAQMLLASVKGESATRTPKPAPVAHRRAAPAEQDVAHQGRARGRRRDPDRRHRHRHRGRRAARQGLRRDSLFDVAPEPQAPAPAASTSLFDVAAAPAAQPEAKAPEPTPAVTAGGSLFDIATPESAAEPEPEPTAPEPGAAATTGGSLFDIATPEPAAKPAVEAKAASNATPSKTIPEGGSLFDIAPSEPKPVAEPKTKAEAAPTPTPSKTIPEGGSLFDLATPEPAANPAWPMSQKSPAAAKERHSARRPRWPRATTRRRSWTPMTTAAPTPSRRSGRPRTRSPSPQRPPVRPTSRRRMSTSTRPDPSSTSDHALAAATLGGRTPSAASRWSSSERQPSVVEHDVTH